MARHIRRICLLAAALLLAQAPPTAAQDPANPPAEAARQTERPGRTGLPLPRFVSLRADQVNLRTGPGVRYPIDWVYRRRDLPVEIIDEHETWRRIRDWEGTIGWVHQSMLQGVRNAMVTGEPRTLRKLPVTMALRAPCSILWWTQPMVPSQSRIRRQVSCSSMISTGRSRRR